MKNSRKKDLRDIRAKLESLNDEVVERLREILEDAENLRDALEEQFDNLSERSQEGEAGERVQDDISDVGSIISDLEDMTGWDSVEDGVFSDLCTALDDLLEKGY